MQDSKECRSCFLIIVGKGLKFGILILFLDSALGDFTLFIMCSWNPKTPNNTQIA
ncbi:hypothetical protein [Helicobacter sp. MIT 05-5294]|uniref:hypothetical protein n=1 Tax=Helicobacter sp. MIT 05-5294 TaxID=1548150 RepID=UPI00188348FB|nr:hypothetical protein [Helicobacter sp. MIT 05-5294]